MKYLLAIITLNSALVFSIGLVAKEKMESKNNHKKAVELVLKSYNKNVPMKCEKFCKLERN